MKMKGFITILLILVLMSFSYAEDGGTLTHTSSADLQPEWSQAGAVNNYNVLISNDPTSTHAINEIRIYQHPDYTDFQCGDAPTGWNVQLLPSPDPTYPSMCWYYTDIDGSYVIQPGSSLTFSFSATAPDTGCSMEWRFETRDTNDEWRIIHDTTSVDTLPPVVDKSLTSGNSYGDCLPAPNSDEVCWIRQDTELNVHVYDVNNQGCNPSGVDYCDYTIYLDGSVLETGTWHADNGEVQQTIMWDEDSNHDLSLVCYDNAGNVVYDTEHFKVDSTAPETTHEIVGPQFTENGITWIDTVTRIELTSNDPDPTGEGCNVGVKKIQYKVVPKPDNYCWNHPSSLEEETEEPADEQQIPWETYTGPFGVPESCHKIKYRAIDYLGNKEQKHTFTLFSDHTAPIVSQFDVGTPSIEDHDDDSAYGPIDFTWVTSNTPITVACEDQDPHPSGHEEFCFNVRLDDTTDLTSDYCSEIDQIMVGGIPYCCLPATNENPLTIYLGEESLHRLNYYCKDAVDKKTDYYTKYFRVDNTAPTITKTLDGPSYGDCLPAPNSDDVCYIRGESSCDSCGAGDPTVIHATAFDSDPTGQGCNVDDIECEWSFDWNDESYGPYDFDPTGTDISFDEDSRHDLTITCHDALGNTATDTESFYVDILPPETTKTYGDPFFSATENGNEYHWISDNTPITFTATDNKVGVDTLFWRFTRWNVSDEECVAACDFVNDDPNGWQQVQDDHATSNIPEQSCHLIEFYSVDKFGWTETVNRQCVFVDTTAPVGDYSIGSPNATDDNDMLYITTETPVTLMCTDQDPHPSGIKEICMKVMNDLEDVTDDYCNEYEGSMNDNGYCCFEGTDEFTFNFLEETDHDVIFNCEDNVGNVNEDTSFHVKVDDSYPETSLEYEGPYYEITHEECICILGASDSDCEETCRNVTSKYIDTVSRINLTANDSGHTLEGEFPTTTYYGYDMVDVKNCWEECNPSDFEGDIDTLYTEPFGLPEDGCYIVAYYSEDVLGNAEPTHYECVYSDHNKPHTDFTYGDPHIFSHNGTTYISNATNITLLGWDTEMPSWHIASGVDYTNYRVTLVDDSYCYDVETCEDAQGEGDWSTYEEPFTIPEQSCHLIEYYSVDHVNKTEDVNKRCVFVDTTGPEPIKTVDVPKDEWHPIEGGQAGTSNEEAFYYPDINGNCWTDDESSLDCWRVTTMTNINMACKDQDPHPVGSSEMCFKVGLDGEDATEDYCDYNGGDMNDNGYCCIETDDYNFHFLEETEHTLDYYCTDYLGNEGEHDFEYFKVHGQKFIIHLGKKWNLISVPFVLLNDDPDVVFNDISDKIITVMTYHDGQWYAWSPGFPSNNLNHILPGWGYWVLMDDDADLVIGGSLMQPGVMPPSRQLVAGWNLIGTYGTELEDLGFDSTETMSYMESDLGENVYITYGTPVYCSLNSLVNTQEGYPKWSALWGYYNYGLSDSGFYPLDACMNEDDYWGSFNDYMRAGEGYWIEMDVPDVYAPATNCIWNMQNYCPDGGMFD